MISKEKLRQRIAPKRSGPDMVNMTIQRLEWQLAEAKSVSYENNRLLRGLAHHLGIRSY